MEGSDISFTAFSGRKLRLMLFEEVTNGSELLTFLQNGTLEPELGFLNADLVPGTFAVQAAAFKALSAQATTGLVTRTLHSELVYTYAASKHISESLKRCGVGESTTRLLVARFDPAEEDTPAIHRLVKGREVGLQELRSKAVAASIQKHFKISQAELEVSSLEDAVVCRIAARDAL